jgi:hypothetical protein
LTYTKEFLVGTEHLAINAPCFLEPQAFCGESMHAAFTAAAMPALSLTMPTGRTPVGSSWIL